MPAPSEPGSSSDTVTESEPPLTASEPETTTVPPTSSSGAVPAPRDGACRAPLARCAPAIPPLGRVSSVPPVAVLREQGVNGQVEMAAAFSRAGFDAVDVHMSDLLSGRVSLADFKGLVACGGFSYGDVLGAGQGWAKSVLFHAELRDMFSAFFARPDSFSLGVCNGCQMLSSLTELIPGASGWPRFVRNRSEQFEARFVSVEVRESNSVLLRGMTGSRLPMSVSAS